MKQLDDITTVKNYVITAGHAAFYHDSVPACHLEQEKDEQTYVLNLHVSTCLFICASFINNHLAKCYTVSVSGLCKSTIRRWSAPWMYKKTGIYGLQRSFIHPNETAHLSKSVLPGPLHAIDSTLGCH